MSDRRAGFFAMVMEYLDIIDAFLVHQREIPLLICVKHFGALPDIEKGERAYGITRHYYLVIADTGHREIRPFRKLPCYPATRKSRVFIGKHAQAPLSPVAAINQHVFLLAALFWILEGIGDIVRQSALYSGKFLRTLGSPSSDHHEVASDDILAQFRFIQSRLFVFFFFLRHVF